MGCSHPAGSRFRIPHLGSQCVDGLSLFALRNFVLTLLLLAVWTNKLPGLLAENMGSELAASVYGDPFTAAYTYPIGTPERDGMITAYHGITRSIFIAAISFTVLQALGCLISGDPELSDEQSDPQAEKKMLAERGWFGFERGHAR